MKKCRCSLVMVCPLAKGNGDCEECSFSSREQHSLAFFSFFFFFFFFFIVVFFLFEQNLSFLSCTHLCACGGRRRFARSFSCLAIALTDQQMQLMYGLAFLLSSFFFFTVVVFYDDYSCIELKQTND